MMAILDEVGTADLEDLDRGHGSVAERRPQARQAAARQAAPRLEVTVEVGAALDRPDDPVDRDLSHAEVRLTRTRSRRLASSNGISPTNNIVPQ